MSGRRSSERANASVEFIGITAILFVPLVYLVIAASTLQSASFGAANAAREAGRAYVLMGADDATARNRARTAVELALEDQGVGPLGPNASLSLTCSTSPCRAPGSTVRATTRVTVPLPMLGWLPTGIDVSAHHVARVPAHARSRP